MLSTCRSLLRNLSEGGTYLDEKFSSRNADAACDPTIACLYLPACDGL